jgi:hypothetical protein
VQDEHSLHQAIYRELLQFAAREHEPNLQMKVRCS